MFNFILAVGTQRATQRMGSANSQNFSEPGMRHKEWHWQAQARRAWWNIGHWALIQCLLFMKNYEYQMTKLLSNPVIVTCPIGHITITTFWCYPVMVTCWIGHPHANRVNQWWRFSSTKESESMLAMPLWYISLLFGIASTKSRSLVDNSPRRSSGQWLL